MRRVVVALSVALVVCSGAGSALAAELNWRGRAFQTVVADKKLTDFLRELAASQGTTAVIDPKVEGTISGRFAIDARTPSAARKVLEDVSANYGLIWYFDGTLLFIEPASEARDEVIPIAPESAGRINATLARMQVGDRRFILQVSPQEGQVFVSGPKRYVDAVRQVIRTADGRGGGRDRSEVRVFRLRYAWANDFEIKRASGRSTTVPGVVSVLRGLYEARTGGGTGGRAVAYGNGGAVQMPRVSGNRTIRLPSGATAIAPRLEMPEEVEAPATWPATRGELPQFQADSRMNAVLVRDVPERMAEYARLIESMDTRPRLVEIEVTIMDISNDSLDRLGVDWRAHGSRADFQTGNGGTPPLTWTTTTTVAGTTGSAAPVGGVFTAAIGSELRNFLLARVSALATTGQANFVARPKLLTLDNTEASIENKSEFFVRVSGFQDASLFTVVAGTDVRVTPLVVDDGSTLRGVLLNINIGDDSLTDDMVDNLPIVRRRSVITQAMVDEGKSVLLAGYSSEESMNGTTGVPGLSSIPVLGNLFKHTEKRRSNVERFYMLTPRFLLPEMAAAPAAADAAASAASAPAVPERPRP
jgi:type III secretion protein C